MDVSQEHPNGRDEQAFEQLVSRFGPALLALAYRLTGDFDEAQDVRQIALVRAYDHRHQFEGRSRVTTWLYRVVVNLCRDRGRRRATHEHAVATLARRNGRPVEGVGPADHAEDREAAQRVAAAVGGLPDAEREVVVLRHYHDLSFGEVAAILDTPVTTIKSRMSRGLKRLQPLLRGLAPHE